MQKHFKCFSLSDVSEEELKEEKLFKGEIFLKNESFWDNFSTTDGSQASNETSRSLLEQVVGCVDRVLESRSQDSGL